MFGCPAYSHLWLGKRSDDKPTWPGLLDCIAAGGIAAGDAPYKAMVKECAEEAGIAADVAAGLISVRRARSGHATWLRTPSARLASSPGPSARATLPPL